MGARSIAETREILKKTRAAPGHKPGVPLSQAHRDRIRVSRLLQRLEAFCLGETIGKDHCNLTANQVAAIGILLRKTIPDLQAIEHSGDLTQNHIVSADPLTEAEWQEAYGGQRLDG
jgi:hypothetical protein